MVNLTYSNSDIFLLLFLCEEKLVESVVLEQTTAEVPDGIDSHFISEALESTGLAVGFANVFHIFLKLFVVLLKWELLGYIILLFVSSCT